MKVAPTSSDDLTKLSEWRGISVDTLRRAKVYIDEESGYYAIPYPTLSGKLWRTKLRHPDPHHTGSNKWLSTPKGAGNHLYNPLLLGPNAREVWFVEGEWDTLALVDAGIPAIGYPGATTATVPTQTGDAEAARFNPVWYLLFEHAFVFAAGEDDTEEAKRAVRSILRAWYPASMRFDPQPWKDVNDWWRDDPDGLLKAVDKVRKEAGLGGD